MGTGNWKGELKTDAHRLAELATTLESVGASSNTASSIAGALGRRYRERHRRYHNLAHVAAMLDFATEYSAALDDGTAVILAIWYHDAVYRPRQGHNEVASARLAQDELMEIITSSRLARVVRLILATERHEPPAGEPDAPLFLDFDLAILGAPPDEYRAYARAIRTEYRWVPAVLYRSRRAELLEGLLQRPAIFLTDQFRARFEQRARENLHAEIARLRPRPND